MVDVVIIGAGPLGIGCGIACKRAGLDAVIFERGALVNSFVHYPTDLEFFSTPDLLEIGGIPFTTRNYKPVRAEALDYFRHVAEVEDLEIRLYEEVRGIDGAADRFSVATSRGTYEAKNVVIATGFFDVPNPLGIPGEDLSKVTHYYREPYPYVGQKVAIIGAKNSAAKAALDCFRHGADVTLIARGPGVSDSVKYWIKPDLENRIQEGSIRAKFHTRVQAIEEDSLLLSSPEGEERLPNDWVLAMTGYKPDYDMLKGFGIAFREDAYRTPVYDRETMESNRKGMYLAGVLVGGLRTNVWFIENSRIHADKIVAHIAGGLPENYRSIVGK